MHTPPTHISPTAHSTLLQPPDALLVSKCSRSCHAVSRAVCAAWAQERAGVQQRAARAPEHAGELRPGDGADDGVRTQVSCDSGGLWRPVCVRACHLRLWICQRYTNACGRAFPGAHCRMLACLRAQKRLSNMCNRESVWRERERELVHVCCLKSVYVCMHECVCVCVKIRTRN